MVDRAALAQVLPGWSRNLHAWFLCPTYLLNGTTPVRQGSESGTGYDILAAAGIYNQQMGDVNVTVGAYGFPYLHQNDVFSPALGYNRC